MLWREGGRRPKPPKLAKPRGAQLTGLVLTMCLAKSESEIGLAEKMQPFAGWRPRPASSALSARREPDASFFHEGARKAASSACDGLTWGMARRLSGRERLTHS